MAAGVSHGGELLNPTADVSQRMLGGYLMALKRVLA
jgi:hypothetical protein